MTTFYKQIFPLKNLSQGVITDCLIISRTDLHVIPPLILTVCFQQLHKAFWAFISSFEKFFPQLSPLEKFLPFCTIADCFSMDRSELSRQEVNVAHHARCKRSFVHRYGPPSTQQCWAIQSVQIESKHKKRTECIKTGQIILSIKRVLLFSPRSKEIRI